jgi:hypothetical protein
MLWSTLAPVLRSTITSLALDATDPLFEAVWRDGQRPFVAPSVAAEIVLRVTSVKDVTTAERYTYTPSPAGLSSAMHGIREFTLNVQARSYDLSYSHLAIEYAERIRTRIKRRSVLDTLLPYGCTYVSSGPIADLEGREDGQALSIANVDLFMRAGFEDTSETGLGWIETISLTSHVLNAAGVEYPREAGNWSDVLMPAS